MIGLQVRFLAGRFHATSWHQAHNEGIPEWPPSPWRILRALVSACYAEGVARSEAETLLEKLRGLPRYRLPRAVDGHTRHYVPETDSPNHDRAKMFDAFVAVAGGAKDPEPLVVAWDADLSTEDRALLGRLASRISYLGRAESWVELTLVDVADREWHCWPDESAAAPAQTSLLALGSRDDLDGWARGRPTPKKGRDVPRTLWDVLTFDGKRYRDEGWSDVPGTCRVRYVFGAPPFERAVVPRRRSRSAEPPTVARYMIRSAVLPLLDEAISVGDRVRTALMSRSRHSNGDASWVFSGHVPVPSNHQHAMYLSASERSGSRAERRIDHVIVSARAGFDSENVRALQSLRRVWGREHHDLELVLVGVGSPRDFGGVLWPRCVVLGTSRVWESHTPFIPTRFPRHRGSGERDGIAEQLRRECRHLLGIEPREVVEIGRREDWLRFRRRRNAGGGRRGIDRAYGARLVFDEPVTGPIALGFGSHFGAGLFEAVEE